MSDISYHIASYYYIPTEQDEDSGFENLPVDIQYGGFYRLTGSRGLADSTNMMLGLCFIIRHMCIYAYTTRTKKKRVGTKP
jgi:hypothetical protein